MSRSSRHNRRAGRSTAGGANWLSLRAAGHPSPEFSYPLEDKAEGPTGRRPFLFLDGIALPVLRWDAGRERTGGVADSGCNPQTGAMGQAAGGKGWKSGSSCRSPIRRRGPGLRSRHLRTGTVPSP